MISFSFLFHLFRDLGLKFSMILHMTITTVTNTHNKMSQSQSYNYIT